MAARGNLSLQQSSLVAFRTATLQAAHTMGNQLDIDLELDTTLDQHYPLPSKTSKRGGGGGGGSSGGGRSLVDTCMVGVVTKTTIVEIFVIPA